MMILLALIAAHGAVAALPAAFDPAPSMATSIPEARTPIVAGRRSERNTPVLTARGYGPITIGSSPDQVKGYTLKDVGLSANEECRTFEVDELPGLHTIVMGPAIGSVVVRSREAARRIRTDRGIHIGSTEQQVRAAYQPLLEMHAQYLEAPAKNLIWQSADSHYALRFEIDEQKRVHTIHAGTDPALMRAEGCL